MDYMHDSLTEWFERNIEKNTILRGNDVVGKLQTEEPDLKTDAPGLFELGSRNRNQSWHNFKINTIQHPVGDGHNTDNFTVWRSLPENINKLL